MEDTIKYQEHCKCCGKPLKDKQIVWLELSWFTNCFYKPGTVPEELSQGCFAIGKTCAKKIIKIWSK